MLSYSYNRLHGRFEKGNPGKKILTPLICLLLAAVIVLACPGKMSAKETAPAKVTKLKATSAQTKILLKWKRVANADGYIIRYKNLSTKAQKTVRLKKNPKGSKVQYELKHLGYHTKYRIWVSAYKGKTEGKVSAPIVAKTIIYRPARPDVRVDSRDVEKVVISWNKVKYADYYIVTRKKSNGREVFVKKTKKTSYSTKDLKENRTYTFVVRAYHTLGQGTKVSIGRSVTVTPERISYYRSLYQSIDDGSVYYGGGDPYRTYSAEQLEAYANYGNDDGPYWSSSSYLLWLNTRSYKVYVFYRDGNGKWRLRSSWPCIIGSSSHPTMRGIYTLWPSSAYISYGYNHAEYATSYSGDNMIHSLLYPTQSDYLPAGYMASNGCVRLPRDQARFVYENCAGATFIVH